MKKILRLTESDLIRLVNRVINEQNDLSSKGFQKWGTGGYLMRLPKGSNNTNDAIRIKADLEGDKFNVIVSVQSNKKVRAEIKGNNVFKKIESILGNKFSMGSKGEWENTSGVVDSNTLDKIVNLLSSLKVDEKNNIFTESDLRRLVKKLAKEQMEDPTEDYYRIIDIVANHAMEEEDDLDEVEKCITEIYKIMDEASADEELSDEQADEIMDYGSDVIRELETMFDGY